MWCTIRQEDRIHDALGKDTPNRRPVEKKPSAEATGDFKRALGWSPSSLLMARSSVGGSSWLSPPLPVCHRQQKRWKQRAPDYKSAPGDHRAQDPKVGAAWVYTSATCSLGICTGGAATFLNALPCRGPGIDYTQQFAEVKSTGRIYCASIARIMCCSACFRRQDRLSTQVFRFPRVRPRRWTRQFLISDP